LEVTVAVYEVEFGVVLEGMGGVTVPFGGRVGVLIAGDVENDGVEGCRA
jgi:hypothetical protein